MNGTHQTTRTRVMIVDPEWHVGLKIADCLASKGYQAVLSRSLDTMLHDLDEMQPTAIVLSGDSAVAEFDKERTTLQTVRTLCPHAPVLSLSQSGQPTRVSSNSENFSPEERNFVPSHRVEELLRTKLGIPCARLL